VIESDAMDNGVGEGSRDEGGVWGCIVERGKQAAIRSRCQLPTVPVRCFVLVVGAYQ
jgi:hypothetical protein